MGKVGRAVNDYTYDATVYEPVNDILTTEFTEATHLHLKSKLVFMYNKYQNLMSWPIHVHLTNTISFYLFRNEMKRNKKLFV